jgi:hypothetical protein
MGKFLICIVLVCNNAFAYTKEDNESVTNIIIDCKKHSYTDIECFEVITSNTYTVPETVLCTYLPRLDGCL